MVAGRTIFALAAITGLSACTSADPFGASRSAFYNPYSALSIENGPVGPFCEEGVLRDDACWIDGIGYPLGRGYVSTADGRIIRLNRNQRRLARERQEAIQSRTDVLESLENGTPIPPDSPALRENQSRPAPLPPTGTSSTPSFGQPQERD